MQIKYLHIYGFGRIENVKMALSNEPLQVFYGKNEAGKSTIMAFIRSILFGFPTKQQSERRFEPKTGGKYGGKIQLETEVYGIVEIERVAGKATGDVTVLFEDGTAGGEEAIDLLFRGMDRLLFQAVFSFDIHGLQGVDSIDADEINHYLLSAGMMGNETIVVTEKYLDNKLKELYKPSGRKPLINQQLRALQDKEKEVLSWEEKLDRYEDLASEKVELEKILKEIELSKHSLKEKVKVLQVKEQIHPLIVEQKRLKIQLEKLPKVSFPEEGIDRLNRLQMNLQPLEAQYHSLNKKLEQVSQESNSIHIFEPIVSFKGTINELTAKKEVYELKKQECQTLKHNCSEIDAKIKAIVQKLGTSFNENLINEIDINLMVKNKLNDLVKKENVLEQEQHYLDAEFKRITFSIDETELRIKELERQVLPTTERQELEVLMKQTSQQDKQILEETYLKNKKYEKKLQRKIKQFQAVFVMNSLFMFLGAGWFGLQQDWLTFGMFVTLLLLVGLFIWFGLIRDYKREYGDIAREQKHFVSRMNELKQQGNSINVHEIEKKLLKDDQIDQQLNIEKVLYQQKEESLTKLIKQSENLELQRFELEQAKTDVCKRLHVSAGLKAEIVVQVFDLIEEAQQLIQQKNHLHDRFDETRQLIESIESKVIHIYRKCNSERVEGTLTMLEVLTSQLHKQEESIRLKKQLNESFNELTSEINEIEEQMTHYKHEIEQLYKLANAADEEAYRRNAKLWQERLDRLGKLTLLESQVEASLKDDFKHLIVEMEDEGGVDYSEEVMELERKLVQLDEKMKDHHSKFSDLKVKMEQLEEGGTYASILHDFQSQKNHLNQSVRQWAVFQVAHHLLQKTKDHYRREKLPKVITKAQEYFSFMTNDKYVRVFSSSTNGKIFVEQSDGIVFEPKELSQATNEQLYLSFRLALASIYESKLIYPILIDDSFVNFDSERLNRALEVIRKVSRRHQILFFTCHDYVINHFQTGEMIHLEETV